MSLTNPNKPVTEARLQEFYHRIKNYLGFAEMPSEDMDEIVTPKPSARARYQKYSTEEQIVGEWIDGKPIYQKTVAIATPECSETGQSFYNYINLNVSVDKYISIEGFLMNSSGELCYMLPKIGSAVSDVKATTTATHNHNQRKVELLGANNSHASHANQLYICSSDSVYNDITGYATVQYTKTTN